MFLEHVGVGEYLSSTREALIRRSTFFDIWILIGLLGGTVRSSCMD